MDHCNVVLIAVEPDQVVGKRKVNKKDPWRRISDRKKDEMQVLASIHEHGASKTAETLEHSHWEAIWKRIILAASTPFLKPILPKLPPYRRNTSIFQVIPKEKHLGRCQAECPQSTLEQTMEPFHSLITLRRYEVVLVRLAPKNLEMDVIWLL
ncbi:hypothetical protein NPIL_17841 [Nephila pilipes]|uniref:Uncharacterized protein n=1 Tax=Nephila pilipes TaxID=299642 RepID=A0A8X6NUZ7_NEPPI|nr:hypothetical protein NPIL_17841 [Nephila pilipes]